MSLGTPIICSNIKENLYAVEDTATVFEKGNIESLFSSLKLSLIDYALFQSKANKAKERALALFSWDRVTEEHEKIFGEAF